jgi:hypothetical protein
MKYIYMYVCKIYAGLHKFKIFNQPNTKRSKPAIIKNRCRHGTATHHLRVKVLQVEDLSSGIQLVTKCQQGWKQGHSILDYEHVPTWNEFRILRTIPSI